MNRRHAPEIGLGSLGWAIRTGSVPDLPELNPPVDEGVTLDGHLQPGLGRDGLPAVL